jgi:hypothetical protein
LPMTPTQLTVLTSVCVFESSRLPTFIVIIGTYRKKNMWGLIATDSLGAQLANASCAAGPEA